MGQQIERVTPGSCGFCAVCGQVLWTVLEVGRDVVCGVDCARHYRSATVMRGKGNVTKRCGAFRSFTEAAFARVCDALGLTWQYEPCCIMLPTGRWYVPDFYVETPLGDCFVELHVMGASGLPGMKVKADKIRLAQRVMAEQGKPPLVVLDERDMDRIRRRARRIK